ncbi:hypothetical protein ABPG74_013024 [Tetrahymena malaccensis]
MEKNFCKREDHTSFQLDLLRLDLPQDERYIICQRCLSWDQIHGKSVLNFSDIMQNNNERLVMPNWPLFVEESQRQIQEKLKHIFKNSRQIYENYLKDIESFYKSFQNKVNDEIDKSKKEMMDQVEQYKDLDNTLLRLYVSIQSKEKLQNFTQQLLKEQSKQEYAFFIQEMENKREQHTLQIESEIKKYDDKISLFDSVQPNRILQKVQSLIKSISFFKDTQREVDIFKDQNVQIQEKDNKENINKVCDLISNKSNFCNQKFLIEFAQFLKDSSQQLNKMVDFSNIHILNQDKPIDFSKVSLIALKEIVEQPNQNTSNTMQQKIQQSFLLNIFIDSKLNIPKNLFQAVEEQQAKKFLAISTNGSSTQIERVGQILNNQHLIENYENIFATAVTTFEIDKEFMYIFRYKSTKGKNNNHCIYAGLISEQNISNGLKSDKYFISNLQDNCFQKIVKLNQNKCIKQLIENAEILEFRVHIKNNLIQVMDYPNYNFIVTIENVNLNTNQDTKYRFGFDFYQPEEKVQLIYFDIVYQQ